MVQVALITSAEKAWHASQVSTPTAVLVYQSQALQSLSWPRRRRDERSVPGSTVVQPLWGGGPS